MVLISHYLENVIIISFLAKSTFKLPFPPSYVREVWDYSSANKKSKKLLGIFWLRKGFSKSFYWLKSRSSKWSITNIFTNYISNKKLNSAIFSLHGWMKIRFFYKNGQKREDKEKLEAKPAYCTEQTMKVKNDDTVRMTNKRNDSKVAHKHKG